MTPAERQTLADFLAHPEQAGRAMSLAILEGYLVALVIGAAIVGVSALLSNMAND